MKCSQCKKEKSLDGFYQNAHTKICKQCICERVTKRRKRLIKNPKWKKAELLRLRDWKRNNKEQVKLVNRNWYSRIRYEALQAYSGKTPKCSCCNESENKFLSIDHINGGGNKHRKKLKSAGRGSNFFLWLKRNKYPKGYQILCYNCNCAKGFYGQCPHKINKTKNI